MRTLRGNLSDLPINPRPIDFLSAEERVRIEEHIPQAEAIVDDIRYKLCAIANVVEKGHNPDFDPRVVDETALPNLDFEKTMATCAILAEATLTRNVGLMFGIPAQVLDAALIQALSRAPEVAPITPTREPRSGSGVTSRAVRKPGAT